jgi:hypothetical protein
MHIKNPLSLFQNIARSSTNGFHSIAVKYVSVYETPKLFNNISRWELLAPTEANVCQTALYPLIQRSKNEYPWISKQSLDISPYQKSKYNS